MPFPSAKDAIRVLDRVTRGTYAVKLGVIANDLITNYNALQTDYAVLRAAFNTANPGNAVAAATSVQIAAINAR